MGTVPKRFSTVRNEKLQKNNVTEDERKQTIEKILKLDYVKLGQEMFEKFIKRLDNTEKQNE